MVADLEADLDDPFLGEWEEEKAPEIDDSAVASSSNQREGDEVLNTNNNENTESILAAVLSADVSHSVQEPSTRDRREGERQTDDSARSIDHAVAELESMNIREPTSDSDSAQVHPSVHTISQPVDIVRRQGSSGASNGSVHDTSGSALRSGQERSRTPSPMAGMDGPMTPRNDAGPFILDGDAGRESTLRPPPAAVMNLDAATVTPQTAEMTSTNSTATES